MKRSINRLRVFTEFIGNDGERAAESRNNRGPHASCAFRGIYLPYICHVPNCITRYVGFLYKMALRSHRLCCHRSICRGMLLSSLISFLPSFAPSLLFFSHICARTHVRVLRLALSPYGSRPCRSFIIHTALKVQHLLAHQFRTRGQSAAKRPLHGRGNFQKYIVKWKGTFCPFC